MKKNKRKDKKKLTKKERQLQTALSQLRSFYSTLPETTGCMENINKEVGSCNGLCCHIQNPQALFVEFLNIWKHVLKNWSNEAVTDLVNRALLNFFNDTPTKGCIFWDKETKLCSCHTVRPFNCFVYGITPKEDFDVRFKRLTEMYKNNIFARFMPQCEFVKTEDGSVVTSKMIDDWWKKLCEIEQSIGIKKELITDEAEGTYRTLHDHMLLRLLDNNMMSELSFLRVNGTFDEKMKAVKGLVEGFKKSIEILGENK
jgi:Fe-S-cluster containining protein